MSSVPSDIDPEKINILFTKLRLHILTMVEARELVPLLENEIREARNRDKREYEKVVIGLTEILKMHLTDAINLDKVNFDVLDELSTMKLS